MSLKSFFKDSRQAKTHPTSVKSRQQMTCSLSFTSKVSLRKVSLREPPGGQILIRDICIAKYNGFCCLQKFNLFPKIEYHSLFSDLFIFYIFSENQWQYFWKYEKSRYSNLEMWVAQDKKMTKIKSRTKNSKLFYMYVALLL